MDETKICKKCGRILPIQNFRLIHIIEEVVKNVKLSMTRNTRRKRMRRNLHSLITWKY